MAWDKTPAQKEAVKAFLVTVNGVVDLEQSVDKYRTVCRNYIAGQTAEQDLIASCMTELFDLRKGATLNIDYIKSQTVALMAKKHTELSDPSLFSMLSKRVEDYLHDNCNRAAQAATAKRPAQEAVTGKTYGVKRGTGGGFCRVADQAPGTTE